MIVLKPGLEDWSHFFILLFMNDIIIIGGGAAGLMAARTLSKKGKSVIVLEARDRIGGRIHTINGEGFSQPVETGAEFMHGELPVTMKLMQEAKVSYRRGEGKMWSIEKGHLEQGGSFDDNWEELISELKKLNHDMPIAEFLNTRFGGKEYTDMRESISRFVQGFDAADPAKASSLSLLEEWTSNEDLTGYHIEGGYSQLMNFLQKESLNQSVAFHLSEEVKEIKWQKNNVTVITFIGKEFNASKVLITIPPAVLNAKTVGFIPEVPDHSNAIDKIETGGVIKFLAEFNEAYWEDKNTSLRQMPHLHFLFTDATIPTWWSQLPSTHPLLTGWLSGPVTNTVTKSEEELKQDAIISLAYILNCSEDELKSKLKSLKVINWLQDPLSKGAYAYRTIDTSEAMKVLSKPIEETIYFAGEAYYDGSEMGTVEAALACGEQRAIEMLKA